MDNNFQEILEKYGCLIQPIVGNSMYPMLDEKKDAVKIIPIKEKLKKYDLPLYQRDSGQYVLHRIIKVKKNYYLICGDNRWKVEKVPFHEIIGITEGFFKDGTYISCQDKKYLSYVKKTVRSRWKRVLKRFLNIIKHKLKRIIGK